MAANDYSLPRLLLSDLLATSPTFRAIVGAASSTAATEHIKSPYARDRISPLTGDMIDTMPRAIINRGPDWTQEKTGTAANGATGCLFLSMEFLPDPDAGDDEDAQQEAFEEQVGAVIGELWDRTATDIVTGEDVRSGLGVTRQHLNMVRIEEVIPAGICEQKNQNGQVWYGIVLLIHHI